MATQSVAKAFCATRMLQDTNGQIHVPDAPGLGVAIDPAGIRRYLLDVEITVGGRTLYRTPEPEA